MAGNGIAAQLGGQTGTHGSELDLGALGRAVWARKLWIAIPTVIALVGTLVVVNIVQPTYRSEARILVESGDNPYTRSDMDRQGVSDRSIVDAEAVASQVQVIMSRDLARQVAGDVGLARRPEFDSTLRGFNPVRQVMILAGLQENPWSLTPEERVLRSYFERMTTFQVDRSRVIAVQFESADPLLAAEAANAVADRFIAAQQANRRGQTREATRWLAGEVEALRRRVEEAEARVESFRARANLFIGSNNTSLTAQQLSEVNSQIASARAQQADAQTRARLLRDALRSGRIVDVGDVVNSEIIRRLNEQRAAVRAQLAEQSSTLGPRHPRINEMRAQLVDLESQIRNEAEKLARVLDSDSRLAGARVETLSQNLDVARRSAGQANEQEVQLRVLEREAKSHRDQLEALTARLRDATARESLPNPPADARIVSRAMVSNVPIFPKKVPTVLIATLGVMLFAIAAVVTGALMGGAGPAAGRRADVSPEPVEPAFASTPVPDPGAIEAPPIAASGEEGPVVAPAPEASPEPKPGREPIASVANVRALAARLGHAPMRIAVIALDDGLTASGLALALARGRARYGGSVVLVDLDGATCHLSSLVPAGASGLADLVAGRASFATVIHPDPATPVDVVPFGLITDAHLARRDATAQAIKALASTYGSVVMVVPGEGAVIDGLAALADTAIVAADAMARADLMAVASRLAKAGMGRVVVVTAQAEAPALAA